MTWLVADDMSDQQFRDWRHFVLLCSAFAPWVPRERWDEWLTEVKAGRCN